MLLLVEQAHCKAPCNPHSEEITNIKGQKKIYLLQQAFIFMVGWKKQTEVSKSDPRHLVIGEEIINYSRLKSTNKI